MAQLWGGRLTGETDALVYRFNASIGFDKKLFGQDVEGSIAHVVMLEKQGIITCEEKDAIVKGLTQIRKDVEEGKLAITDQYEDIHSFVEAELIRRIGDAGKKMHTGRSRNDQVALDMKLYVRGEILELSDRLLTLSETLLTIMEENQAVYMPGFTHLQKAQPTTLAHHMGAYFEMFKRDLLRLSDIYKRMNYCPLGAGAFAGTTYPLDRAYTASLLGFEGPTLNSMDSVADRDYLIELLAALSTVMMHLSRFSEEIIIWNSNEYQFVEIDDAYNKDMQEDKEVSFDAIETVKDCLVLFNGMLGTMKFNHKIMEQSAMNGFTNATDAADYLVGKGVPFRDAHGIIGRLVLYCIEKDKSIDALSLEELKQISPVFEADIYDAISLKTCVEKRLTIGAPGSAAMAEVIRLNRVFLDAYKNEHHKNGS